MDGHMEANSSTEIEKSVRAMPVVHVPVESHKSKVFGLAKVLKNKTKV